MGPERSVRVAEATSDDADGFARFLTDVWERSGPDAPGFAGATDEVIAELTTTEAILARLGDPAHRLFLAWVDDDVIGFSATRQETTTGVELAGIVVDPAVAGSGVGTRLVELAIDRAAEDGFHTMVVRTETSNDRAVTFYEGRGFVREGTAVEDVDGTRVEVWELRQDLGGGSPNPQQIDPSSST